MLTLAPVLRKSVLAVIGVAAAAGTAAAQGAPRAACPTGDVKAGAECPAPAQPVTREAQPSEALPAEPQLSEAPPPAAPMYTQPAPMEPYEEPEDDTLERYGIALSLGGGVAGFTDDTMRDTSNDGGAWGVRASIGTRSPIAFEGEYTGSAQSIDALGLDNDAVLVGNGLQGALRVNILDMNVQPFLFGGLAWRHYNLTNEGINTSDISDSDDVLEIPMGAGIAWKYRGFLVDARGEFRYASQEDMVPDIVTADGEVNAAEMHRYGVTASLGYAF